MFECETLVQQKRLRYIMEDMTIGSGLDKISDLPSNVTDIILGFLPLKEAVRASTLSKTWQEKWHSIPNVILDEKMFEESEMWELEGIINYILTTHEGRIDKFSVSIEVSDSYNMNSWGVEELSLILQRQIHDMKEAPSILFSCQRLRKLSLPRCIVKPPWFYKGFQSLVSLQLNKVNIESAALKTLISCCPLLQQLTLRRLNCGACINIDVPKLKYFSFDGEIKTFCFKTPVLEVFSINVYRNEDFRRTLASSYKISGLPSTIKELCVRNEFQKFMAACDISNEVSTYSQLRTLGLSSVCFDQVQCLLSLIGNSLDLTTIDVSVCDYDCRKEAV